MRSASLRWGLCVGGFAIACGSETPAADVGSSGAASSESTAATGADSTGAPEPEPLEGIADLHLHMFAEHAFGGGWFHGSHAGDASTALGPCDGGDPGDHGRLRDDLAPLLGTCTDMTLEALAQQVPLVAAIVDGGGGLVGEFIATVPGSDGDTGAHADRKDGHPDFGGWPRWDAIAHQQVWHEQLHAAWQGGLRLSVVSAVSLDWLCRALPDENLSDPSCDEMADVRRQLEMAAEFDAANDWFEIALTPEDARRIVGEGNLAIVLSVEASHIMQSGDWRPQFEELYALGVRTLQPVHQLDSRFGGAAPHNPIFGIAQYAENCHIDYDCGITTNELTLGFDVDESCRNVLGLTEDGRALVEEMFARGMLVDAAHLSEKSLVDLHAISVEHDYYPFYLSHGHFREIMIAQKQTEEKTTPAWAIEMVRETGGMFGLRTAHEETDTYEKSAVANNCHGSSRSFAQAYDYGRLGLGVAMGLGSDLNGFIQQTRPRFGPDACSASFPVEATCQAAEQRNAGPARLGADFDEIGLGHAATLPSLLDDLDQLGSDSTPLRRSANDFVRMWERAAGERSGPVPPAVVVDTSGIVEAPSHYQRTQAFPTECDEPYCAGGLVAGDECRFAAECESGVCSGAGECGTPRGVCG
jgi:microsomal dipeptidase-like Zn-dependent dipeptidase